MEGIYTKKINEESTRPSVSNTNSGKVQVYLFVQRKEKPLNHFTSNINQSDDRCSAEETTPFKKKKKKKGPLLAPSWLFSSVAFFFGPYHTLGHFCSSGSARLQLSSSNSLSPGISLQTVLGDSANLWKLNWLQLHTRSANNDTSRSGGKMRAWFHLY